MATTEQNMTGPVQAGARLASLDVLRGFALLGILVINIQWFSMPAATGLNPTVWGDLSGVNFLAWLFSHVLFDQKMMTLFSMLFGAGLVLFAERLEARGLQPVRWHLRRQCWLLLFGAAHAYLLWYGDILFLYALCAFAVYPMRRARPRTLVMCGLLLLSIASALNILAGWSLPYWPDEDREAMVLQWMPDADTLATEVAAYQGGWLQQMSHRVPEALYMHTEALLFWGLWRASGLMLIGMALYKSGVLRGQASRAALQRFLAAGLCLGLPLVSYGVYWNFSNEWQVSSLFLGNQFNYWGSILVSLAWMSVILWLVQGNLLSAWCQRLAAVGQTAFSNYIMHTLLAGLIFYGHGLGLFGQTERWAQLLIVFGIWALQLYLSPLWLRHYRYGPLEWLWRSLTYWQVQPWRR